MKYCIKHLSFIEGKMQQQMLLAYSHYLLRFT